MNLLILFAIDLFELFCNEEGLLVSLMRKKCRPFLSSKLMYFYIWVCVGGWLRCDLFNILFVTCFFNICLFFMLIVSSVLFARSVGSNTQHCPFSYWINYRLVCVFLVFSSIFPYNSSVAINLFCLFSRRLARHG